MKWLTVERGAGFRLVKCRCGWREIVFTDRVLEAEGNRHLAAVHDVKTGFGSKRKARRS